MVKKNFCNKKPTGNSPLKNYFITKVISRLTQWGITHIKAEYTQEFVMSLKEEIINNVSDFLRNTGISRTRFGLEFCNDGKFIADLFDGRDISISKADELRKFMREYETINLTNTREGRNNK